MLAANAPDIDMLAYTQGEYFALAFRRGITHGWPALLVLPFVVTAVMLAWDRWIRRRRDPQAEPARAGPLLGLSFLGLLTHPALDWMNTYGMRWGLPFDGTWSYGDSLFIIDPWIWLVLGGAVLLTTSPGRPGLVGWSFLALATSAIVLLVPLGWPVRALWTLGIITVGRLRVTGWPDDPARRVRLARIAGVATLLYIATMMASDAVATRQVARYAEAAGLDVRDVMVGPQPANPFVAEVEVLTADAYVPGEHRWLGGDRVRLFTGRAAPLLSGPEDLDTETTARIVESSRAVPRVRNYLVWSRYPYVRVARDGTGWTVRWSDARYDERPGAGGLAGVEVRLGRDLLLR